MAIIKCPECGRQISDKAPVCPNCGVEIAGKITKCPHCGEVYFSNMEMCPNCHDLNPKFSGVAASNVGSPVAPNFVETSATSNVEPTTPPQVPTPNESRVSRDNMDSREGINSRESIGSRGQQTEGESTKLPPLPPFPPKRVAPQPPIAPRPTTSSNGGNGNGGNGNTPGDNGNKEEKKKSNRSILIISLIFAVLVCGIMYYFYDNANRNKEQEAYEYAMQSSDPTVLQSYLDTYQDADEAHRDSIMSHLQQLKQVDQDWTNAVVSGSKEALEAYLQKYPNSPHKQEAWNKIDSIDWNFAKTTDTVDGYQAYLDAHADGAHIEEAENALKKVKSRDLQPEEKQMVAGLFRQFFQSINSRNSDGLAATCEDILSSLLGKSSATKADVVTFMNKLYKDDIANMNWRINNDYQIKKREVGDEDYEYQVQFSARQDLDLTDGSKKENLFRINAVVSPDGKVSSFNMSKIEAGN